METEQMLFYCCDWFTIHSIVLTQSLGNPNSHKVTVKFQIGSGRSIIIIQENKGLDLPLTTLNNLLLNKLARNYPFLSSHGRVVRCGDEFGEGALLIVEGIAKFIEDKMKVEIA